MIKYLAQAILKIRLFDNQYIYLQDEFIDYNYLPDYEQLIKYRLLDDYYIFIFIIIIGYVIVKYFIDDDEMDFADIHFYKIIDNKSVEVENRNSIIE